MKPKKTIIRKDGTGFIACGSGGYAGAGIDAEPPIPVREESRNRASYEVDANAGRR